MQCVIRRGRLAGLYSVPYSIACEVAKLQELFLLQNYISIQRHCLLGRSSSN